MFRAEHTFTSEPPSPNGFFHEPDIFDHGDFASAWAADVEDPLEGFATATVYVSIEDGLWASSLGKMSSQGPGSYAGSGLDALGGPLAAPGGWSPTGAIEDEYITVGFDTAG